MSADQVRGWRDMRGVSQRHPALDTGISRKHVSIVDSGRSRPSPQVAIDVSDALDVPLRERNPILVAAGHAPRCPGDVPDRLPALQGLVPGL